MRFSDRRLQILEMLRTGDCALGAADVAGEFDLPIDNVRRMLARMAEAREIERCGRGRYRYRRAGQGGSDRDAQIKIDSEWVARKLLAPNETASDLSETSDPGEVA